MVGKYFDILEIEYATRPKIFNGGLKKKLRKIVYYAVQKLSPKLKKYLDRRWAYDTIYVMSKKHGF